MPPDQTQHSAGSQAAVLKPKLVFITAQNMASANIMYPVLSSLGAHIDCVIVLNNSTVSSTKGIKPFIRLIRRCAWSFLFFKLVEGWAHSLMSVCRGETIDQLCRKFAVPVIYFGGANDPNFLAVLQQKMPDYLVSTGPAILSAACIATAQKAVLNCHGARLPFYRGPANYIWTLLNGDKIRWATIHRLVKQVDAGAIWREASFPIHPEWSVYEYDYYHALDCGRVLASTLSDILAGNVPVETPQDETQVVTRTFPTSDDMARFKKLNIPLWRLRDVWRCVGFTASPQ